MKKDATLDSENLIFYDATIDQAIDQTNDSQPESDLAPNDIEIVPDQAVNHCKASSLALADYFDDDSNIATYRFDHSYNTLEQTTSNYGAYNAIPAGTAKRVSGKFNQAVQLSATASLHIDSVPLPTSNTPRAISFWLRLDNNSPNGAIFTYGKFAVASNFFSISLSQNQNIALDTGDKFITTNALPQKGIWHHLALSYDSKDVKLYFDGQEVLSQALNLLTSQTDSYGKAFGNYDNNHPTEITIDQARFFNRSLSEAEILALSEECLPPVVTNNAQTEVFFDDFGGDLKKWNTWGTPLPQIIQDDDADNGFCFDSNGDGSYLSGADSNFSFSYNDNFAIEYRFKQPKYTEASSSYWLYFAFGVNQGQLTGNGQYPLTYFQVSGSNKTNSFDVFNPYGLIFYTRDSDRIFIDNFNDFNYHTYRLEHTYLNGVHYFNFYVDGTLYESLQNRTADQTRWYITVEGRSRGGVDNHLDWVKAYLE